MVSGSQGLALAFLPLTRMAGRLQALAMRGIGRQLGRLPRRGQGLASSSGARLTPEQVAEIRERRGPDLSSREFAHQAAYFYEMYQEGYHDGRVSFPTRVKATWGLIANGPTPFLTP
jgi:hypothetical protein